MMRPPARLTIRHAPKGQPYHEANSIRGLRRTVETDCNAQDVDTLITIDNIDVATHWPKPLRHGFYDPAGLLGRDRTIASMTFAEVRRLRSRDGKGFKIQSMRAMLRVAAALAVTICAELKPDRRWRNAAPHRRLRAAADRANASLIVMSQPRALGRGVRYLKAAKAAGLPTMLLTRGPVWPTWWQHLDYVKGRSPRLRTRAKKHGVIWLGPGSPNGGTRIA